jgi:hypothetical protein
MNEILTQIIVSGILGFISGFSPLILIGVAVFYLLLLIIVSIYSPDLALSGLKSSLELWRFVISFIVIFITSPLGRFARSKLDKIILKNKRTTNFKLNKVYDNYTIFQ